MPVSALDSRAALVVIDLQRGIVGLPTAHPAHDVVALSAKLASAFRERGLPVVIVNVAGVAPGRAEQSIDVSKFPAGWDELVPEMAPQPGDLRVTKHSYGAFTRTDLEAALRGLGVTQIVLCGIATSIGVETTARAAYELGFNVAFATDAMTDMSIEAHENSVGRIFPRLGERGLTADILALLKQA